MGVKMNRILIASLGFATSSVLAFGAPISLKPIVTSGLNSPVHITHAPGESDRLYIVEQAGRIKVYENGLLSTFLDIRQLVRSGGERGLLSVAFHPQYNTSGSKHEGRFFVNYTANRANPNPLRRPDLYTIIAEYKEGKEKILKEIYQRYSNHNGGQIDFGPDGFLYIGMGDGGSGGDPNNHAQNKRSLLGKMLRIDVNKKGALYGIPEDNPYADGVEGEKEIFAIGLRNPWRFSFDRKNGTLFAADVGQGTKEEIDIVENGKNYGWRVTEGTVCHRPAQGCDKTGLESPIHDYGRNDGFSVTGGFVYRGSQSPTLAGKYIYGDYGSGNIWALEEQADGTWKNELLLRSGHSISSFGEDLNGEIYLADHSGKIYQIETP